MRNRAQSGIIEGEDADEPARGGRYGESTVKRVRAPANALACGASACIRPVRCRDVWARLLQLPVPRYRRPAIPPTCAPLHPAKGCVYVASVLQYAIVDYPLQLPVNTTDTVTLILSGHDGGLSLGPSRGTLATAPIHLPADVSQYRDIAVVAETIEAPGASATKDPIVW